MITVIAIIVGIVFGKFVWDTYITGKTHKDWAEFRLTHPHEARVIDNSKGLDFRTTADIRTDGLYIGDVITINDDYGATKSGIMLIFNNKNEVAIWLIKDDKEISELAIQIATLRIYTDFKMGKEIEDDDLAIYTSNYTLNRGGIRFSLEVGIDQALQFEGTVIKNGLIMDLTHSGTSINSPQGFSTKIFSEQKIEFIPIRI